ncbi:type VII secretion target [Streptomyces sp. NPDC050145]|uniref:type VII secretion target n=1 Tax=Streptomyces sp. NPDC050145 TaxID=3365602 RepID=UPI003793F102
MTLKVVPGDLKGYAKQVGRAADDAHEFRRHCDRYTGVDLEETGLIGLVAASHHTTVPQVEAALTRIRQVLDAASVELTRSARYYEATDRRVASRLDAAYPVVERPAATCS